MRYRGWEIDPIAFWSRYVEFPSAMRLDSNDTFTPKVTCPNPAHDTLKHHFQINVTQPTVHCFAYCGISGSYEHAICVIEGLYEKFKVEEAGDKREEMRRKHRAWKAARKIILRQAAGKARISSKPVIQKKSRAYRRTASTISSSDLEYESFLPQFALEYLDGRGISPASVSKWGIGWDAEERRIVIPVHDENNRLKFLIKRATREQDHPKYLYTEGFPKTHLLFGVDKIDLGMIKSDGLILVEGGVGVILNHQDGFRNTAAILGTGISKEQCRIIARINPPKIFLFFDKDLAGIQNIEIAVGALRKYPLYVVRYPRGKDDADKMTREEKYRQLTRAVPAGKFVRQNSLSVKRRKERKISVG
jgi:DNA primase